jgi:hypothetical protein
MVSRANKNAAAKFDAMLEFLERSSADVARATGLGESYFSKVRKGLRGVGSDAAQTMERILRIDRRYWDDESPVDPKAFMIKVGAKGASPAATPELAAAVNRARLLELARVRGESDGLLLGLLRAAPPTPEDAADPWWWFATYLNLLKGQKR